MSSSLLHPPAHLSNSIALQISQKAPSLLRNAPSSPSTFSPSALWSTPETADLWAKYENLMLSCLRTGDEQSARLCMDRLTERFGQDNERILALRGLLREATAQNDAELKTILADYDEILKSDPTNMPVTKRRIALLRSISRIPEAIAALSKLLESSPIDAEAWGELADLYVSQGMYQQAIFALEEVLLIAPYAWNIHARLGEVLYMAATAVDTGAEKYLADSFRRFCRSIELCDDYLRGYYGLKLVSSRLLKTLPHASRQSKTETGLPALDLGTIERLNEAATAKLSDIVRRSTGNEAGWVGYDEAELIAARELLNRDVAAITR